MTAQDKKIRQLFTRWREKGYGQEIDCAIRCLWPQKRENRVIVDTARFQDELIFLSLLEDKPSISLSALLLPILCAQRRTSDALAQAQTVLSLYQGKEPLAPKQWIAALALYWIWQEKPVREHLAALPGLLLKDGAQIEKVVLLKESVAYLQCQDIEKIGERACDCIEEIRGERSVFSSFMAPAEVGKRKKTSQSAWQDADQEEKMFQYWRKIKNLQLERPAYQGHFAPGDLLDKKVGQSFEMALLGKVTVQEVSFKEHCTQVQLQSKGGSYRLAISSPQNLS